MDFLKYRKYHCWNDIYMTVRWFQLLLPQWWSTYRYRDIITGLYYQSKKQRMSILLSFTGYSFTWLIGIKPFGISRPIVPSYGSWIYTQKAPIIYSWSNPVEATTVLYSWDQFIWSISKKSQGNLLGIPATTSLSWFTVTGISSSSLVTRYAVRGNTLMQYTNININTKTWIFLDNTISGIKRIITLLYKNPNQDGFLMHFQKQSRIQQMLIRTKQW